MTAKTEVIALVTLVTAQGSVLPGGTAMLETDEAKGLVARGLAAWPKVEPEVEAPAVKVTPAPTPAPPGDEHDADQSGDVDGDGDVDSRDEVITAVAMAIRALGDAESNPDAFTAAGMPKLEALSEVVGYQVGSAARADALALLAEEGDAAGDGDE